MVGKKNPIKWWQIKLQNGALKCSEVIWRKKHQKEEKNKAKKRLNLGFTLDISPVVIP